MIVYADGSSWNGHNSKCCVVKGSKTYLYYIEKEMTNNEMEYWAVIKALEIAKVTDLVKTDSQLVVGQLTKGWAVNCDRLRPLKSKAMQLMSSKGVNVEWIPREESKAGKVLERLKIERLEVKHE